MHNFEFNMVQVHKCPIEVAYYKTSLHKKWTLTLMRDLLFGFKHFSDFLRNNSDLSAKVLSERLKDLEAEGLIEKIQLSESNGSEYYLTMKGMELNRILYELSVFGARFYTEEVFHNTQIPSGDAINIFASAFRLDQEETDFQKARVTKSPYIDMSDRISAD